MTSVLTTFPPNYPDQDVGAADHWWSTASVGNHPAPNPRFDEYVTLRVCDQRRVRGDDRAPTHDDAVFRHALPSTQEHDRCHDESGAQPAKRSSSEKLSAPACS